MTFSYPETIERLSQLMDTGAALFIGNVARYAEATKVTATLKTTKAWIYLSIRDNGKEFNMTVYNQRKTPGLLGMKERAAMMGGKLEINSIPGKGTSIIITVPLSNEI